MEQLSETKRPLYYVDKDYAPEIGQNYSNWNNHSGFLPDMRILIWDQLDYYIRYTIKIREINSENAIKILSAFKTARKYNDTCQGNSTIDTVVTHMYVCELLVQTLCMLYGKEWAYSHGYHTSGMNSIENIENIFYAEVLVKKGLSQSLHELFFTEALSQATKPTLAEYLSLCPEVTRFMYPYTPIPRLLKCEEHYGATGDHIKNGTYHAVHFNMMEYYTIEGSSTRYDAAIEHTQNFPELEKYYICNRHTSFSIEDETFADKFISTTGDPYGKTYALAFGNSRIQKQRDVEIRLAIVFILGSLGRYRPWIWSKIEEENPEQYFIVKQFLEHNHQMFPYLILRYLSGKNFTFIKTAIWG